MMREWDVRFVKEIAASPEAVWDTITKHSDGYLWPVENSPSTAFATVAKWRAGSQIACASLTPIVDGGVEVRPLLGFEVVGEG